MDQVNERYKPNERSERNMSQKCEIIAQVYLYTEPKKNGFRKQYINILKTILSSRTTLPPSMIDRGKKKTISSFSHTNSTD